MKNLMLIIFTLTLPYFAQAQNREIKNFYHKYKKADGARKFVLPGFLIWLGTGIANESTSNEEAKVALRFAKKFKTMRFLIMEEGNEVTSEDYNQLVAGAKKGNYEELISIKDKGQNIHIMGRGKKDKLKNLLILVSEEDSFIMMNMKTNIRPKDLNRLINDLMKLDKVRNKIKKKEVEETPVPTEKKKEEKKAIKA